MGCTSSAQNMADKTDATENTETDNNEAKKEGNETSCSEEQNNINKDVDLQRKTVTLPTCDNLTESLQIPSHNGSAFSKDTCRFCGEAKDSTKQLLLDNATREHNDATPVEKLTNFIEVADKVLANKDLLAAQDQPSEEVEAVVKESEDNYVPVQPDESNEVSTPEVVVTEEVGDETEDKNEEHESPTQSDCSRSTRWEALADIAAELPPSMAVDPITGQIYSLSK